MTSDGPRRVFSARRRPRTKREWLGFVYQGGKRRLLPLSTRVVLVEQLGRLVEAGIPVLEALEELRKAAGKSTRVGAVLERLRERVESGETLTDAARAVGGLFDGGSLGLLQVGEGTGKLGRALSRLAQGYRRKLRMRRRFLVGAAYPAWLVVAACAGLPLRELLVGNAWEYLADVASSLTWVMLAGLFGVAVVLAGRALGAGRWGRRTLWHVPIIRNAYKRWVMSGLFDSLALCLDAGLGMPKVLELARESVSDPRLRRACEVAVNEVERGGTLTEAFGASNILDGEQRVVLAAAEKSGTLVEGLSGMARDLSSRAEASAKVLMVVANLALTVLVVGVVATQVFKEAEQVLPGGPGMQRLEQRILKEAPFIYR